MGGCGRHTQQWSGLTPGRVRGTLQDVAFMPRSAVCKAVLSHVLSLPPEKAWPRESGHTRWPPALCSITSSIFTFLVQFSHLKDGNP